MLGRSKKVEAQAKNVADDYSEGGKIRGRSLSRDARDRFLQNKASIVCVMVITLIMLFVFFGPTFSKWNNEEIDWAVLGDIAVLGAPSVESGHFFGTDALGRDLYSRVIQATGTSLLVGFVGAAMALIVGTGWGVIAGYYGGRIDAVMMRIVDILYSVPATLFIILILVVAGRSMITLFIALGAVSWLTMSRIVRGQTLALKNREFVEAARAGGVSEAMIIFKHILPNLFGVVIVYASLLIPEMIYAESFISFLGLGISEPHTSLGALISEGAGTMGYGTLWQLLFPLTFYVAIMFAMFFIGDGLRDAFDPKDR